MELTAEEAWSKILESARATLPEQTCRTWLDPTKALALSSDRLVVGAPSDFAVEWIEGKFGELLTSLAQGLHGAPVFGGPARHRHPEPSLHPRELCRWQ
jgi:chromosomal replication initiation ATPase DnaA